MLSNFLIWSSSDEFPFIGCISIHRMNYIHHLLCDNILSKSFYFNSETYVRACEKVISRVWNRFKREIAMLHFLVHPVVSPPALKIGGYSCMKAWKVEKILWASGYLARNWKHTRRASRGGRGRLLDQFKAMGISFDKYSETTLRIISCSDCH